MNPSPPDAARSPSTSPIPPSSSGVAGDAGRATSRDEKRTDLTGWRRDHGRRAITRMCLARRCAKIEARDATLPVVIAYREAQERQRARAAFVAWRFRFGAMRARLAYAATYGEAA